MHVGLFMHSCLDTRKKLPLKISSNEFVRIACMGNTLLLFTICTWVNRRVTQYFFTVKTDYGSSYDTDFSRCSYNKKKLYKNIQRFTEC